MTAHTQTSPLPYQPSYEPPEDNEAETNFDIQTQMREISTKTYQDSGHAIRSVHAKSHGLLTGSLTVLDNLPAELAQGLFAKSATYPVVLRLSTVPGDILDDKVSTPRGLSMKVIGVDGARLDGSEGDVTQDFVLVNGPVFSAANAKKFLGNLKMLAKTTDKAPKAKEVLSAVLQGVEKVVEAVGGESVTLKSLGGHPETNPLGETYYSQSPFLYGPYMAKFAVFPVTDSLLALKDEKVDLKDRPDGLRDAMLDYFARNGGDWELRVQFCRDIEKQPIDDTSVEWKEEDTPYIPVARIHVDAQTAWSEARTRAVDDGMAFSVWHGLAAHRPIGSVNRIRKAVYESSKRFRAEHNNVTISEPGSIDDVKAKMGS